MRALLAIAAALLLWEGFVRVTALPPYLLPGPLSVGTALWESRAELAPAAMLTAWETVLGLALGATLGIATAAAMVAFPRLGRALSPALVVSQTIPVFALAPILTLWLGFGMAPKVAMVVLIVFVPVTQALYDGLMSPPAAQMDVVRTMGAGRWAELRHLRFPAALPRLASGLRLGAIYAPVGAVIGEWVGGARGLGALMIQANGRMKIDLMFAALIVVVAMSLTIYTIVDRTLARMLERRGF
ncbi:ABC transporter permease [Paracoccus sp. MC1862]|uniref:ABC transporter permease n=1 Tax=Paracoccus sp. MC1862 TaxID=2760307 RepID=UPI001602D647|nr:ABC transporter permease [Paracoccus sp. MC1862]MBB1499194.1 ABC transporter permease [Paracoccus sp. MC1862]QQO45009.1 ABC transporter permease [Paracoccus sp. MC1862]